MQQFISVFQQLCRASTVKGWGLARSFAWAGSGGCDVVSVAFFCRQLIMLGQILKSTFDSYIGLCQFFLHCKTIQSFVISLSEIISVTAERLFFISLRFYILKWSCSFISSRSYITVIFRRCPRGRLLQQNPPLLMQRLQLKWEYVHL